MFGYIWLISRDGDPAARALFDRHYSRRHYANGRTPRLFVGPGEKLVLVTPRYDALLVWRKFISADQQEGVNCMVFRNEGPLLSSTLIREAEYLAWGKWPGERFYTYVDPRRIRSTNPGCCFKKAGWTVCGTTRARGLLILERRA